MHCCPRLGAACVVGVSAFIVPPSRGAVLPLSVGVGFIKPAQHITRTVVGMGWGMLPRAVTCGGLWSKRDEFFVACLHAIAMHRSQVAIQI